ncbi:MULTISPECIES: light-harvesting antenna LH1, beta subunit [Rhodomicrobium]|jgi:light-harvesting complex 1 beta chain|uniref:light-harvesting antenna LH1, beta subunit n=1 Tax=Rhodomicrobium TaxID=1068 RepID=UPI000F8EFA4E|nr:MULTISPECIES: light-harvesting antenna LH1, beta subunit [Rhodomicrobium]MBT3070159.1 light-harvesting protein [Rhodomicrobium sp. Az07]WKW51147.1 light-harvesting antenna LH1, beta subunit [Rhodomicrobium lacus]
MAQEERDVSLTGLTEGEAKEFHSIFVASFIGFSIVAIIAHVLAWNWRPWARPLADLGDGVQTAALTIVQYLA